jgi:hypothetical protein
MQRYFKHVYCRTADSRRVGTMQVELEKVLLSLSTSSFPSSLLCFSRTLCRASSRLDKLMEVFTYIRYRISRTVACSLLLFSKVPFSFSSLSFLVWYPSRPSWCRQITPIQHKFVNYWLSWPKYQTLEDFRCERRVSFPTFLVTKCFSCFPK